MIGRTDPPARIAAWWRRGAATVVDGGITLSASLVGALTLGPHPLLQPGDHQSFGFQLELSLSLWWIFVGAAYVIVLTGTRGQTLGKIAFDVRVVRPDGSPIGYRRAFARWLVTGALWGFGLYVGGIIDSLVAFRDDRRRTIHDLVVDTVVIRASAVI